MPSDAVFSETDASSGVEYFGFYEKGRAGFRCVHPDGSIEYIYFVASNDTDDGKPNVFVYQGPHDDPCQDAAVHHYLVFEDKE